MWRTVENEAREEDLSAMALRTKPHTNPWLYLSPRLCALGQDAFDDAQR